MYQEWSIGKLLEEKTELHGERTFIYYKDKTISYNELNTLSNKLAHGLLDCGIRKGDKVGILSHNNIDYVALEFAVFKIGAICVPINRHLIGDSLVYILNHADIKFLYVESNYIKNVKEVLNRIHAINYIVREADLNMLPDSISYEKLASYPSYNVNVMVSYDDPALLLYTSGTTGLPKGVIYEHYALIPLNNETYSQAQLEAAGYSYGDVIYLPFPLYHVLGQVQLIGGLRNDCQVVLAERFSATNFWNDVRKYNVTIIVHQGASIPILLKNPPSELDKKHKVRLSIGAGVPNEKVWREFEERFGVKIFEYYASTEGAFFGCGTLPSNKPGTIGKSYPFTQLRVVDDYGKDVGVNKPGELLSKLDSKYMRKKPEQLYYKEPWRALERFTNDGWFKSGDIVYVDEEGYYHYVGRKETFIRCRGENISPEEIENIINTYPSVDESVAVGIQNREMGDEDVKVVIKLKEHASFDYEEFIRWCEKKMPYFMVPRYIEVSEEPLKRSEDTSKLLRAFYRNEGVTERTWDRLKAGVKISREKEREKKWPTL
jgi:carnitine-CoA ligase